MKIAGHRTKKATVETGLNLIIALNQQEQKITQKWDSNLEKMGLDQ